MEDNDELIPDENGHLDVKYQAWTEVDNSVWELAARLVSLDLSYNSIETLPDKIGSLSKLKELDVSCNKLQSLPSSLGQLRRLKVLKANGNEIRELPDEIGNCRNLKKLVLSENRVVRITKTISQCEDLKVLKLQNNNLRELPPVLARLRESIEEIDLSNNPDLDLIPNESKAETVVIMWILAVHLRKNERIEEITNAATEMQDFMVASEELTASLQEQIAGLEEDRARLREEINSVSKYIAIKRYAQKCGRLAAQTAAQCQKLFRRRL